jgi:hypothetical protein
VEWIVALQQDAQFSLMLITVDSSEREVDHVVAGNADAYVYVISDDNHWDNGSNLYLENSAG